MSGGSGLLRSRLTGAQAEAQVDAQAMHWVNRLSGLIIAGFGVAALVSVLGFILPFAK